MTKVGSLDEIATTTTNSEGNWTLTADSSKVAAGDILLLSATNPINGIPLHSVIAADDVLTSENIYSSETTTISHYTEAAYLVGQTSKANDIDQFLKKVIHLNDSGLPTSTGQDVVDALGVWIKSQFDDPQSVSGATYHINLLDKFITYNWPTFLIADTDAAISLPSVFVADDFEITIESYQGIQDIMVDNSQIAITAGNAIGQGQVVFALRKDNTQQMITLPVNIVSAKTTSKHTISAGSIEPITTGSLSLEPAGNSFAQDTTISITELDLNSLESQKIGNVTIDAAFEIQIDMEPTAPVQINYQLSASDEYQKIVLIHVNPVTKVATYVYPDSYDEKTHQLKFTVDGFSPDFFGTSDSDSKYKVGSTMTVNILQTDSTEAFGFMRQIYDFLNDGSNLRAIQENFEVAYDDKIDKQVSYMMVLASKALTTFLNLSNSNLDALKNTNFK